MQATMVDGKFLGTSGTAPDGQDIVVGLLNRCLLWAEIVLERYRAQYSDKIYRILSIA